MKILFVDDHDVFVSMICGAFLTTHDVTVAKSLDAARERLSVCNSYEVVLLDFDLPDGKGKSLVHHLKAMPTKPLIIAFSSHDDGNSRLMAAGADVLLGKMNAKLLPGILTTRVNEIAG